MKTRLALMSAVLLLALTGCTESVANAGDGRVGPAAESATPTPEGSPTASPEPVVAESPAALEGAEAEAAFLTEVRSRLAKIQSQIPNVTDGQLVVLAHEACDRIAAGTSGEDMTLIEGEERTNGYYMDTAAISTSAALTMCPRS